MDASAAAWSPRDWLGERLGARSLEGGWRSASRRLSRSAFPVLLYAAFVLPRRARTRLGLSALHNWEEPFLVSADHALEMHVSRLRKSLGGEPPAHRNERQVGNLSPTAAFFEGSPEPTPSRSPRETAKFALAFLNSEAAQGIASGRRDLGRSGCE